MTIEEFIQQLEALVNSKSPLPGQAPLFIPNEVKQILYEQPSVKAAADQAVVALTGTNSPISAGDIYRVAGMTSEPQLTDSQYTAGTFELPNFLGVPRNYEVDGVSIYTTDDQGEFLFYQSGSQYALMANQPPEIVAAIQAELVNANLLKLGEFVPGSWGGLFIGDEQKDVEAFKKVLEHSNQTGNPDFTMSLRFFVDNLEATNIEIIESSLFFCNQFELGKCTASTEKNIFYSDDNHLTIHGANLLVEKILLTLDSLN